jgi:hypothetical protein
MSCFNGTWTEWQLIMRQCCLVISDQHLLSSEEIGWCSNILGFLFMRYEFQLKETLVLGVSPELRQDIYLLHMATSLSLQESSLFSNVCYVLCCTPPPPNPSPICWFSFVTGFEYSNAFVTI